MSAAVDAEPAPGRARDVVGEAGRVLVYLRADVAQWQSQDRIDDGVAADLVHYFQRLREVLEALEDAAP